MFFRQIHSVFSFRNLLKLLVGLAIGVQLIVILYNHLSGYFPLEGYSHFFQRLVRGSVLSLLAGFLIAYPDLYVIRVMNRIAPWDKKTLTRIPLQLGLAVVVAAIIAVLFTSFANWISAYTEELSGVYISNILIFAVVNILVMSVFEAWIFSIESKRAKQKADHLLEELSQIKFEVLKSQINPHFMFNSLNVLSGLIKKDIARADQFIDEFSHIYRYVLETIEQPVTTLSKELDFMRSYFFLQQIRYGDCLTYTVDIPAHLLHWSLPPLSLQVLLENAIKHNIVNEQKPLRIEIACEHEQLIVRNNLQTKISGFSTGLGLKNLVKRYALISNQVPEFKVINNQYVAKIPLLNTDNDERTDH